MGEIKSVKVDNWGVFFLQKLQNFFNKTDYCDLTLQFRDNSQLKVHRLVLSACTDYFNVLENTCEVIDDALIMPNELQADVVVPIVNFMYTGTLEFELRMYGKLLRTAKEMNMTVLLKLLEAHRRTMEGVNRSQRPPSPKPIRRRGPLMTNQSPTLPNLQPQTTIHPSVPGRRIVSQANSPAGGQQQQQMPQRRIIQAKTAATNTVQASPIRQVGQTTLIRTTVSGSGGNSLLKQETGSSPASTFEQLRKGYNNNKRPAPANFVSPPSKKPNIEDVKEFAEQQRMRKQIAAEYGDDPDYDMPMDDDIHADDDDDEAMTSNNSLNASSSSQNAAAAANKSLQQQQAAAAGETTITFKAEQGDKPPTIVVKDSSNSKMNHAKIISEVLRQYPHLAKGNKNIKLKIMSTAGGQAQKIIVKREVASEGSESPAQPAPAPAKQPAAAPLQTRVVERATPQLQHHQPKPVPQKPVAAGGKPAATIAPQAMHTTPSTGTPTKRRIDSKTMHALIALGAENTTGPWLCLRCGVNGRPISIPTYRGFRRHLVNTHKESIDPALCENCGKRSNSNREQHFHNQVEHNVRSNLYTYPECLLCSELFLDNNALNEHMMTSHPDANNQQCIYCNKIFGEEEQLLAHMKAYHKRQAMADGIVDCEEDSLAGSQDENDYESPKAKSSGVKILSNITLPHNSTLVKMGSGGRSSSEAAALSTVASGIATSIAITSSDGTEEFISAVESEQQGGTVTKFVNADGNEMVLTDELRKEIMSQLNQEHEVAAGGVVMVLNEGAFVADEATQETTASEVEEHLHEEEEAEQPGEHDSSMDESEATAGELRSATADEEEYDDSQIYGEFLTQEPAEQKAAKQEALDESKSSVENMEWAESLLSAHEAEEAKSEGQTKVAASKEEKEDDISKKLKELTGDWSEDENDEEEVVVASKEEEAPASVEAEEETQESVDKLPAEELVGEEKAPDSVEQAAADTEEAAAKAASLHEEAEEDDLELAMENLHKDDSVVEEQQSAAAAAAAGEEEADQQQVSALDDSQGSADLHAQLHEAPTTTTIDDTDPQHQVVAGELEEEEVLAADAKPEEAAALGDVKEEEDAASTLLDKLVTEKAGSVEAVEETPAADEKESAAEEATAEFVESAEANDEVKDEKDKSLEETPAEVAIEAEETVKDEAADQEFLEEKAEASSAAAKEALEGEATEAASPEKAANTSDKMKSLISEWVDDDDEEEEEVAEMEEI